MNCPLCSSDKTACAPQTGDGRPTRLCTSCSLIFVEPAHQLDPDAEKAYYGTHENSIADAGYVAFLDQLVAPLGTWLAPGMHGLDFGCGPGPTLSTLVRRYGVSCDDYDPCFADIVLHPPYDFVLSTECFEHFRAPARDIARIAALLKPGGVLGVMTERWQSTEAFTRWHYTRDPTHVSFYHADSFDFICAHFGLEKLWMDAKRVVILRKRD